MGEQYNLVRAKAEDYHQDIKQQISTTIMQTFLFVDS
jgi:hypothetical protein